MVLSMEVGCSGGILVGNLFLFLTAASAKAAEFYSCWSFKLRVTDDCFGFLVGIYFDGDLFFGGGVSTSSSEFYYLTLVAGCLQRVYLALG